MRKSKPPSTYARSCLLLCFLFFNLLAVANDWPQWRFDAYRSGASPKNLPEDLALLWSRDFGPRTPVWEDPLNRDLMPYDRAFEPIVVGKLLILGFNDSDKVAAFDTESGREVWRFVADGPIRLPPAAWKDRVFVASDDGFLYCLNAASGSVLWRFQGAPELRRILGNRRLISSWPSRGGPVVKDGKVYFACGIWPFMGIFIYALEAETGRIVWINDGEGCRWTVQPHNSPAFSGIAPQGPLVATDRYLLVPGGRSVPACFDRTTGKLRYFHLSRYNKTGGAWVFANERDFFCHERRGYYTRFNLERGTRRGVGGHIRWGGTQPVVLQDMYFFSGKQVRAYKVSRTTKRMWSIEADAAGDLIKAGQRLYAGGNGAVTVISLGAKGPKKEARLKVPGKVARLVAGDRKLFVVTLEGRIFAFGAARPEAGGSPDLRAPATTSQSTSGVDGPPQAALAEADLLLRKAGVKEGYALWYGLDRVEVLRALLERSSLHIVAFDTRSDVVEKLRCSFDRSRLYGLRVHILRGAISESATPPYLSSISIVGGLSSSGFEAGERTIKAIFRSLRPYGGTAILPAAPETIECVEKALKAGLIPGARMETSGEYVVLRREGPLPGAGVWTHLGGNEANTLCSTDRLVKLPLGILWFGGNSHLDVLPRHGHGPPELVIGGRLFLQGIKCLSARDVYTGRVLWKVELPDLDTFGVYYDDSFSPDPYTTAYNQKHIPGTNARGSNMAAAPDSVYIVERKGCRRLDVRTGKTLGFFSFKSNKEGEPPPPWAFIAVSGDSLIGGKGFADLSRFVKEARVFTKASRFFDFRKAASAALVVMDRKSGAIRWETRAEKGYLHHGIALSKNTLFCLDKLPAGLRQYLRRRGRKLPPGRLVAFDLKTGRKKWEDQSRAFGTNLAYSARYDLLLQSGRPARDTLLGESGNRMVIYRAETGEVLWDRKISYTEPPVINGRLIIAGSAFYDLLTGEPVKVTHPIDGMPVRVTYQRGHGCNYAIGSPYLITFRSSAAGFFDLIRGGVGNFGGFKSGCTSNLVAADGVLNAPDYTRTCSCSFQNQTSLALVFSPEMEFWTYNNLPNPRGPVAQIGLNFGAPGDRRDEEGILWLEYPVVGGPSPDLGVRIHGRIRTFRHNALRLNAAPSRWRWIAASGIEGECTIELPLRNKRNRLVLKAAASHDDAEENERGLVNLISTDLELTQERTNQVVGIRFGPVPLRDASALKRVYLQFTVDEISKGPTELEIRAAALDNVPPFTAKKRSLSSLPCTTAAVKWKPKPWGKLGEQGPAQRTGDLSAVLREVLSRPGWRKGNHIGFLIRGSGKRVAVAFDGSSEKAPRLVIELKSKPLPSTTGTYTVTLVFSEPGLHIEPQARVFQVLLDEKTVLPELDLAKALGGRRDALVRTFQNVQLTDVLKVRLVSLKGKPPVLSGLSIKREEPASKAELQSGR